MEKDTLTRPDRAAQLRLIDPCSLVNVNVNVDAAVAVIQHSRY